MLYRLRLSPPSRSSTCNRLRVLTRSVTQASSTTSGAKSQLSANVIPALSDVMAWGLTPQAAVLGTAVVAATTIGLHWSSLALSKRKWTQEVTDASADTWTRGIRRHVARPFNPADHGLDGHPELGHIPRPDESQLRKLLAGSAFVHVEGPPNSGKSYGVAHQLAGRPNVIYMSCRSVPQLLPALTATWTLIEVTTVLSSYLRACRSEDGKPPVIVIDDVQEWLGSDEADALLIFLKWAMQATISRSLTVVTVSSDFVTDKLVKLSGFRSRLVPVVMRPAGREEMVAALRRWDLRPRPTDAEINLALDKLGSHFGDVAEVLLRRKHKSVEDGVDAAVVAAGQSITSVLYNADLEGGYKPKVVARLLHGLTTARVLALGEVAEATGVKPATVIRVARELQACNLLHLVDPLTAELHRPVLQTALTTPAVIAALQPHLSAPASQPHLSASASQPQAFGL